MRRARERDGGRPMTEVDERRILRPLGTWGCRFVVRGTSVLLRVYRDTTKGNCVSASIPVPSSLASVIERVMHLSLSFVGSES
jgi:hypothetical protein